MGFGKEKTDKNKWLRTKPVGRDQVADLIKDTCKALSIYGTGLRDHVTRHGLHRTVATVLLDSGEEEVEVQVRTEHMSLDGLKWHTNLRGRTGKRQKRALFGTMEETERDIKRLKSDIKVISESGSMKKANHCAGSDRDELPDSGRSSSVAPSLDPTGNPTAGTSKGTSILSLPMAGITGTNVSIVINNYQEEVKPSKQSINFNSQLWLLSHM